MKVSLACPAWVQTAWHGTDGLPSAFLTAVRYVINLATQNKDAHFHEGFASDALRRMGLKTRLGFLLRCHYTLPEHSNAEAIPSVAASARLRRCAACCRHSLGVAKWSMRAPAPDRTAIRCSGAVGCVKGRSWLPASGPRSFRARKTSSRPFRASEGDWKA